MKPLLLLPISILAAACAPNVPYDQQRPPYRNGEPYYPYGPGGGVAQSESGTYERIPDASLPPPAPRDPSSRTTPQPDPYGGPEPTPAPRPSYPLAKRTANPNEVISPYAPYNVIDVEGFKSGALAKDPSNQKIFRVP